MTEPTRDTSTLQGATRILVVEDHPIVRQGYKQLIDEEGDLQICAEAETVADALQAARRMNPHLVIVDILLDDGSGLELIKELKARHPKMKMLAVSAQSETIFARRCLEAGALGFINKKAAVSRLITAIRRVLAGKVYLSEEMSQRLLTRMAGGHRVDTSPVERLTDRELEAFVLIGQGLSKADIAEQMKVSVKTVDRYREKIKEKLELANATELVQHAVRWVLENQ